MNIWELLGIEPTEDIAKIKTAYARQAKLYHPEEHPEEFKALQNAYKLAVSLARSRKAGISVTYIPSGRKAEVSEEIPHKEQEASPAEKETAEAYDFSGVDTYGDRENFLRQFMLLAKNPYLKNRVETWDYFLHRDAFSGLFPSTDFRRELVEAICSVRGWRRKTILYLEQFLSSFHTEENKPKDGRWETEDRNFLQVKRPGLRLPAFLMDRFLLKEGRSYQKQLRRKTSKLAGREIDLDVQLDLVRYINLYLSYGEADEAQIERLYRGWRFEQRMVAALFLCVCLLAVIIEIV